MENGNEIMKSSGSCRSLFFFLQTRYPRTINNPQNYSINSSTPSVLHNDVMWNMDNKPQNHDTLKQGPFSLLFPPRSRSICYHSLREVFCYFYGNSYSAKVPDFK